MKLLVRLDSRVQNMRAKIGTLASKLSNLTLILKQSQAVPPAEHGANKASCFPRDERTVPFVGSPDMVLPDVQRTRIAIAGAPTVESSSTAQIRADVSRRSPQLRRGKRKKSYQMAYIHESGEESSTDDESSSSDEE